MRRTGVGIKVQPELEKNRERERGEDSCPLRERERRGEPPA